MARFCLCGRGVAALANLVIAAGAAHGQSAMLPTPGAADEWFLEAVRAPQGLSPAASAGPVVVAIVDDGMRTTHRALAPFIWTNEREIPDNGIDDDGNGYVDDVHGWDVSDSDGDVGAPAGRDDFFHGTHLAGLITGLARRAYGDAAPEHIRILPVKALSDRAPTTLLRDGYRGVSYAIEAGADVIVTAWSQAFIAPPEERVLETAARNGIVVVASVGNFPENREQFPAAHPAVLAVTSVDRDGNKSAESNYGSFVDLAAPGQGIRGPGVGADDEYVLRTGTSFSAALVAGAAALVRSRHPMYSPQEIEACLKNTSMPLAAQGRELAGRLGAGVLNVAAAVDCEFLSTNTQLQNAVTQPEGFLRGLASRADAISWMFTPAGEFRGIRFTPVFDRGTRSGGTLEFRSRPPPEGEVLQSFTLDRLPDNVYVPGSTAHVSFVPNGRRSIDWLIEYEAEPIDYSTLYCSGEVELDVEATLTDGSGPAAYSPRSNCRWLITAPPDKRVEFRFDEIDTESRTDMIFFFDGSTTRQEQLMAIFSGNELPPVLTSWSNQVLVWFVTNETIQGQGWRAQFRFVDP